jgi:hypothetical protein
MNYCAASRRTLVVQQPEDFYGQPLVVVRKSQPAFSVLLKSYHNTLTRTWRSPRRKPVEGRELNDRGSPLLADLRN